MRHPFIHVAASFAGAALLASALVVPAAAAVGEWAEGSKAKVRLIAEGVGEDGKLAAAIEILLPPGWKTYWRNPGAAGIAPTIDFSASRNVAGQTIAFPVPHRYDDGYAVTNVYEDRVVLPVAIDVTDRALPVELVASLDLGVCEVVCIPEHVETSLTVPAGESDPEAGKLLAAARKLLPGPPEPGVFAVESVTRVGGTDKRPVFRLVAVAPAGADRQVFVEGPEDWSPYTPVLAGEDGGSALYDVKFSRLGARTPIEGVAFRVTIAAGGRAIEQTVGLD